MTHTAYTSGPSVIYTTDTIIYITLPIGSNFLLNQDERIALKTEVLNLFRISTCVTFANQEWAVEKIWTSWASFENLTRYAWSKTADQAQNTLPSWLTWENMELSNTTVPAIMLYIIHNQPSVWSSRTRRGVKGVRSVQVCTESLGCYTLQHSTGVKGQNTTRKWEVTLILWFKPLS